MTDHKPLLALFSEHKCVPPLASGRIQRWALTLSAYEYVLKYRKGCDIANADALSRLPISDASSVSLSIPGEIHMFMDVLQTTPTDAAKIKHWTSRDPALSQVLTYVQSGWPDTPPKDEQLRPYVIRKDEISVHDGCLLWGQRVIVPKQGHETMINELHDMHPGVCKMKALARSYIWWPGIDMDIESKVRGCNICQVNRKLPASAPLHPWEFPQKPWSRIHLDYAGPFLGKMFLIVVDAYSKWLDALPMNSSTSSATIEKLRRIFAEHGLPNQCVTDNGTCFTSSNS